MKNLSLVSMFAAIGLVSCFLPITEEVVFAVEDNRSPVIVVSSPAEGSVYMSKVIVKGYVRDDSLESGDNKGSLSALSISASSSRSHRGRIEIDSDGSYDADTDFGQISDTNFTYNSADRSFTIKINTTDYRSQIMYLVITAVDRNGNESRKTLELVRSAGPYIGLTSPSGNTYSLDEDIEINGTAANSDSQRDKNDELKTLTLQVPALNINDVTLNIANGETRTNLETRKSGTRLTYNTDDSTFSCAFSLWDSEKDNNPILSISVIARDKNDNVTRVNKTIRPATLNPTVYSNLSVNRTYYYSAASSKFYSPPVSAADSASPTSPLIFGGKVLFGSNVSTPELKLEFYNTSDSSKVTQAPRLNPVTGNPRLFTFDYRVGVGSAHKLAAGAGRVKVTLIVKDSPGSNRKTEMIWYIDEDSEAPVFSAFSTTKDMPNNTVTLRFKVEDAGTAGTGVKSSTLSGSTAPGSNPDLTFSQVGDFQTTEIDSVGANVQKSITIEVEDKIKNTKSITTPVLDTISIASEVTSLPTVASPGEGVILTVTASKPLDPNQFRATIAGVNAAASVDSSASNTLRVTAEIPAGYAATSIPFVISGFKDTDGIPGICTVINETNDSSFVTCLPKISTHSIDLKDANGNRKTTIPAVGDIVAVKFTTATTNPALSSNPVVELTSNNVSLTVAKDNTVSAPVYKYTHTIVAGDLDGTTSVTMRYTIKFPNGRGGHIEMTTGSSTFPLNPANP